MCAAFSAVFITRFMSKFITVADSRSQGMAGPLVLGWTGMRGVVSLAAALAIPLYVPGTQTPFPERSMMLYITFVVITLTLVFQGLTLPILLKWVKFPNYDDHLPHEETERMIRIGMAQASLDLPSAQQQMRGCYPFGHAEQPGYALERAVGNRRVGYAVR